MITISPDKSRLDVDMIHRFLSEESYWAKNVPRHRVERAIEHSICFAAFDGEAQIGFARVVTDRTAFAYIGDVFVLPSHRRQGGSKKLLEAIRTHAELQGLRR